MPEKTDTPAVPDAASPELIAKQVMSHALGVPLEYCSADSMGARFIREGIKRFAAVPRLYSDEDRDRAIDIMRKGVIEGAQSGRVVDAVAEALGMRRAGA